jgi:hypothetical protein
MTFSLFLYMLWSRQALLGNKPFCWSSLCFLIISIVWSYIYELWSLEWQGYFSITCLIIYLICLFIFKWISKLKVAVIFQSTSILIIFVQLSTLPPLTLVTFLVHFLYPCTAKVNKETNEYVPLLWMKIYL